MAPKLTSTGTGKERADSPLMTESQWNEVLQRNGFSGNDICLQDVNDDTIYICSMIMSSKNDKPAQAEALRPEILYMHESQRDFAANLGSEL